LFAFWLINLAPSITEAPPLAILTNNSLDTRKQTGRKDHSVEM